MERTIDVKPAANQLPSIETVPAKPTPVRKTAGLESTFNCKDSFEALWRAVNGMQHSHGARLCSSLW